jgi:hypothetical protein
VITLLGGKRSAAGIREGYNGGEIFFFGSHPYLLPKRSTFFTQIIQFPPIYRVMGSLSDLLPLFLHSYLPWFISISLIDILCIVLYALRRVLNDYILIL